MCDPVTITALTVASTLVTAGSQIYAADAQAEGAKYEAAVADRNAKLVQNNIDDAKERGKREQLRNWRRVGQDVGAQRAMFAASGLDVNFGTPADVVEDTMAIGYEDAYTIEQNTQKEVRGFDIERANYEDQAAGARHRAKGAKTAGYISAGGSILGGATQIATSFAPGGVNYKG